MTTIVNIVAVVILGFLLLRLGRERRSGNASAVLWLKIVGLLLLGIQVVIYLIFGLGEMTSGDLTGAVHLVSLVVVVLLGIMAWLRPFEGGIVLFVFGFLSAASFLITVFSSGPLPQSSLLSSGIMITAVPQVISGILFFIAGLFTRRVKAIKAGPAQ